MYVSFVVQRKKDLRMSDPILQKKGRRIAAELDSKIISTAFNGCLEEFKGRHHIICLFSVTYCPQLSKTGTELELTDIYFDSLLISSNRKVRHNGKLESTQ
jgi:hypothetical protein